MPGMLEMSIEQFFEYLDCRKAAMAKDNSDADDADTKLVISSTTAGQPVVELDVVKDVLYMIDLDMPKFLPRTFDDFVSNFKMKEILPGGKWCMMNAVSERLRLPSIEY
jgi:glutamyl-tRNA reductase